MWSYTIIKQALMILDNTQNLLSLTQNFYLNYINSTEEFIKLYLGKEQGFFNFESTNYINKLF